MPVFKMTENKFLMVTKSGNTYQGEHNAETIKIILPKFVNNIDVKDCVVYLSFVNQEKRGNVIDITEYITNYSDKFYSIEIPMYKIFTYKEGNIKIWIKILNSGKVMVAKTNSVEYMINSHDEVDETIPDQELELLEHIAIKLDATAIKVDEISNRVQDIAEGDEQIIQPILLGEIYGNNS